MLFKRIPLSLAVATLCLALGSGAAGLRASKPGVAAGEAAETKESKEAKAGEESRQLAALAKAIPLTIPLDPAGLYRLEGFIQDRPIDCILGMRADRTPTDLGLRALEDHPDTQALLEDADKSFTKANDWKSSEMDAGAGFGSNVCFKSPLLQHIDSDFRSGCFGSQARPLFLDVGAGVGYNTKRLVDIGARVVANDQSTQQLAVLLRWLRNWGGRGAHIHLTDGDIFAKYFPGGTFDGILCSHLLHYLRPRELATLAAQFREWLKPGARL
jgi:hypothetical protein